VGTGTELWSSASWRESAVSWLDAQLATTGAERTGEVDQPHLRPWATALRAPTTRGPVWLKACGADNAFEVELYLLLHRVVPSRVLTPIAVEVTRGWIVLPDGGEPLGERVTGTDLVDALATILPRYGQMQRDLAPHADRMLALGVADMRAAVMPARFGEALRAVRGYVDRRGTEADRTTCQRVAALRETYVSWCDRLTELPGSASLDHNDLHPWNMLVGAADGPVGVRFYDWGDSVVAHPFASALVPLTFLAGHLGAGPDAPGVLRVRDAYLDAFSDLARHAELVETLELACRVGKAARALTWYRAVRAMRDGGDDPRGFASAPLASLESLLHHSYIGGA
jgi:Phosphotransferase enzyme family